MFSVERIHQRHITGRRTIPDQLDAEQDGQRAHLALDLTLDMGRGPT